MLKHENHSEIIFIIENYGAMTINKKSFDIKSGDFFRIPKILFTV